MVDVTELTHSVSSTREYQRCPRRYRFAYVDRVPPDRLVPQHWRFGSVVHAGLEAGYRYLRRHGDDASRLDAVLAGRAAVDHAWDQYEMPPGGGRVRAAGLVASSLLGERLRVGEVLGVEALLATDTADGRRIAGYADLILRRESDIEIRDHKVSRFERTPDELAGDLQLNLYGWLARRRWPCVDGVVGAHHYPLSGRTVRVELTDAGMDAAAGTVRRTARAIERDDEFAPMPGAHCGHCPWFERCSAGRAWEEAA